VLNLIDIGRRETVVPRIARCTKNHHFRPINMVQTEQMAHSLCRVIYSFHKVYGDSEGVRQKSGGETGIRTLDTLRYTRFPSVRLQPLGHLSAVMRASMNLTQLGPPKAWPLVAEPQEIRELAQ
jgi:hypothetical protein